MWREIGGKNRKTGGIPTKARGIIQINGGIPTKARGIIQINGGIPPKFAGSSK
ncbi:hypothetical protein [Neobacillus sp. LXY-1]|uniref:hypothetical protein n=1 Tax=Neobacillus sp. LXY-1 TaxID=3379133 RepID=UPI003EDEE4C0